MTQWILVIILIGANANPAITTIPGFYSKQECIQAQAQINNPFIIPATYSCIKQEWIK